ncbi:KilA-N domain-containing protein [Acinetobacter haemolyticus]|uniref:KilA-N domain-containing protein n=1 Tax=Acinetobacter haemolyticus TaxID=29430 RepID=A0A857IHQ1_ACIHA|nr:KilA-N domain-containing protein [Acinetobacter haemolyticus]ENW21768.1 hypothetical protein F926_01061 [Acinetobacter haemolyticus NIPH 261]QHI09346.1 KilA-N domain-containing protein [Acinetobacter haemolyticus]QHI12609.1 KilA-N domain-containing protein [Acinetobacter haemolyticus]
MDTSLVPTLYIDDNSVRVIDGLYSLNDLHKAAGGIEKHKPANFMRLATTQELIYEIEQSSNSRSESIDLSCSDVSSLNQAFITILGKGKEQGTYVCKELVYAYAMWINPKFHLAVIRTFDNLANSNQYNSSQQQRINELESHLQRLESLITVRNYGEVHPEAVDNNSSKQAMLDYRKNWRQIYDLVNKGLNSIEIGIKLELDSSGVRRHIRQMRACGILPPDPRQAAIELEKELIAQHKSSKK